MFRIRVCACFLILSFATAGGLYAKGSSGDWPAVTPEEKAIRDCPDDPGCPAMILYRSEQDDDVQTDAKVYFRIKVFTNEGRKYADVEVPFVKDETRVSDIDARTIQPDGRTLDFDGKVYEKTVVKGKGNKVFEKAFTLPAVGPGCIIEYRYVVHWGSGMPLNEISPWTLSYLSELGAFSADHWVVQHELYTRRAHFEFRPLKAGRIMWTWHGLPQGVRPVNDGPEVVMDVANIPAMQKEDFMPPSGMVQSRVDFFYVFKTYPHESAQTTGWYWDEEGKIEAKKVEKFIGKRKGIKQEVEKIISDSDAPEAKLRKLYARAQQVRNLSAERQKTEKEEQREKLKVNRSTEDVLENGYGYGEEINEFFAAMARAGGFDAHMVELAPRSRRMFVSGLLNWGQLTANVVEVQVGSKKLYFDPATPFCPYAMLPWEETASKGMRLEEDKAELVATPGPRDSDDLISRKGSLTLGSNGDLQGKLEVVFGGQEALRLRLDNRDEDAAGRRKALEAEVKSWLPAGATVELKNSPDWISSSPSLQADFEVKLLGYASAAGSRLLLAPAVFQSGKKYPFQSSKRKYPIFFHSPFQRQDDLTIELPAGYRVESLPATASGATSSAFYEVKYGKGLAALHFQRQLEVAGFVFLVSDYPELRAFYDKARVGDGQQAVLKAAPVAQAN